MKLSIEQRLDILESREQIKELRAQYAWCAARGHAAGIGALFTEDCVFEAWYGDRRHRIEGRAALQAFITAANMKPAGVVPLINNDIIEIDGDSAQGTCAMQTPVAPNTPNGFVGYYHDRMRRENGRWLFVERRYYLYAPIFEEP